MKKQVLLSLGFIGCLLIDHLSAQAPSRITLRGTIAIDTFGEPAALATVMLLNPADSTLITFTRSDERGVFAFKNLRNTAYFLKISYVGYLPYQQYLPPAESETVDLGRLVLKPIQRGLMEVVVRTAKAPLFIRGDTIEYDATMFKVPPGSTVEDLLRRLPGIEVDEAGNIKAQGRDVRRIYVDGKTFFGSDPKLATKNLEAEIVSKVQVFDEKSEIAQLLGIDDGKKERVMNLSSRRSSKREPSAKVPLLAAQTSAGPVELVTTASTTAISSLLLATATTSMKLASTGKITVNSEAKAHFKPSTTATLASEACLREFIFLAVKPNCLTLSTDAVLHAMPAAA